jgi:hypothetical protein
VKVDCICNLMQVERKTKLYVLLKVKVKLSLCLNRAPCHESVLGVWRYSSTFLTSTLAGGEWSASHTGCFTPRERSPVTHQIGGWGSPRASLDTVVKKKFPAPAGAWTSDHPACSPALYHWAVPAPLYILLFKLISQKAVKFEIENIKLK